MIRTSICIYLCIYIHTCMMYTYMYIYIHVYIYTYVYIIHVLSKWTHPESLHTPWGRATDDLQIHQAGCGLTDHKWLVAIVLYGITPVISGSQWYLYMEVSINWGIQNGWFIRENPIKMDDLGVPPFQETSKFWRHTEKIAKVTMLIATKKYSRLPDTYSLESLQLLALWQCSSRAQSPGFLIRKPTAQTKIRRPLPTPRQGRRLGSP